MSVSELLELVCEGGYGCLLAKGLSAAVVIYVTRAILQGVAKRRR